MPYLPLRPLCALLLLACLLAPLPAQGTEISFWTTEKHPDRLAVIHYLTQVFNLFNGDVTIRVTGVGENLMVNRVRQAARAGNLPDLIGCAANNVIDLDSCGMVDRPATRRILTDIGPKRFFPGPLRGLQRTDGQYSGLPFNGWVQGIWYRKDWFEEHNLEPPDTWERILKAARTLYEPGKGRYGILLGRGHDAYAQQTFAHLALSAGVRFYGPGRKVLFDSPATVETVKFYAELARYAPPEARSWRGRDYYFQNSLAMMFYSTFIMDDLAVPSVAADSLTDKNFTDLHGARFDPHLLTNTRVCMVIEHKTKAGYGVVHALGVLKGNDPVRTDAVERFVRFLYTADAYMVWLHMVPGGMLPVLRGIADKDAFYRDPPGVFQKYSRKRIHQILHGFTDMRQLSKTDADLLQLSGEALAEGVVGDMLHNVLDQGMPAEEAVSLAADRLRQLARKNRENTAPCTKKNGAGT